MLQAYVTLYRMKISPRVVSKHFITRIDIGILVVVIMLLSSLGVVVKLVLQQDKYITVELLAAGGEWWWGVPPPYYWNSKDLQVGSKEYDSIRKPIVEILDVVKYDEDNRSYMWIKARLLVTHNYLTKQFTFRQETLKVGNTIHIAPNNISIIGNVVGIEGFGTIWGSEYVTVTGRAQNIDPWEADSLRAGDKILDNKGDLVAEVLDSRVELADVMTMTWTGEALQKKNPLLRDVNLTVKMRVMRNENLLFFNYFQSVGIGNKVRIQFPKIAVEINVMSVTPASE